MRSGGDWCLYAECHDASEKCLVLQGEEKMKEMTELPMPWDCSVPDRLAGS